MNKNELLNEYLETKNEKLKNDLIHAHTPLIREIIKRSFDYPNLIDDMFQVGCLGLLKAIDNYDPARGQFSTLAYHSIKNHIIMFLKKETNEFGSHLHKRVKVDPIYLETIPAADHSFGVNETIEFVFSKLPGKDVAVLQKRFGMVHGKVKHFEAKKSMTRFSQEMRKYGIKRSDFYR